MSDAKFRCPECRQVLEGDQSHEGTEVQCPACNKIFKATITAPEPAVPKLRVADNSGLPQETIETVKAEIRQVVQEYCRAHPKGDADLWCEDAIPPEKIVRAKEVYATPNATEAIILLEEKRLDITRKIYKLTDGLLLTDASLYYGVYRDREKCVGGAIPLFIIDSLQFKPGGVIQNGSIVLNGKEVSGFDCDENFATFLNGLIQALKERNVFSRLKKLNPTLQGKDAPETREALNQYELQTEGTCHQCGYKGLMAVPGYAPAGCLVSWPAILIGFCFGFVPGVILFVIRYLTRKQRLLCPVCKTERIAG